MREIKFRGKDKEVGKWVYGLYISTDLGHGILDYILEIDSRNFIEIDCQTLGEYTGLFDKHDIDIYEGDILEVYKEEKYVQLTDSSGAITDINVEEGFVQRGFVSFISCSFAYTTLETTRGKHEYIKIPIDWLDDYKIVGNVHEI